MSETKGQSTALLRLNYRRDCNVSLPPVGVVIPVPWALVVSVKRFWTEPVAERIRRIYDEDRNYREKMGVFYKIKNTIDALFHKGKGVPDDTTPYTSYVEVTDHSEIMLLKEALGSQPISSPIYLVSLGVPSGENFRLDSVRAEFTANKGFVGFLLGMGSSKAQEGKRLDAWGVHLALPPIDEYMGPLEIKNEDEKRDLLGVENFVKQIKKALEEKVKFAKQVDPRIRYAARALAAKEGLTGKVQETVERLGALYSNLADCLINFYSEDSQFFRSYASAGALDVFSQGPAHLDAALKANAARFLRKLDELMKEGTISPEILPDMYKQDVSTGKALTAATAKYLREKEIKTIDDLLHDMRMVMNLLGLDKDEKIDDLEYAYNTYLVDITSPNDKKGAAINLKKALYQLGINQPMVSNRPKIRRDSSVGQNGIIAPILFVSVSPELVLYDNIYNNFSEKAREEYGVEPREPYLSARVGQFQSIFGALNMFKETREGYIAAAMKKFVEKYEAKNGVAPSPDEREKARLNAYYEFAGKTINFAVLVLKGNSVSWPGGKSFYPSNVGGLISQRKSETRKFFFVGFSNDDGYYIHNVNDSNSRLIWSNLLSINMKEVHTKQDDMNEYTDALLEQDEQGNIVRPKKGEIEYEILGEGDTKGVNLGLFPADIMNLPEVRGVWAKNKERALSKVNKNEEKKEAVEEYYGYVEPSPLTLWAAAQAWLSFYTREEDTPASALRKRFSAAMSGAPTMKDAEVRVSYAGAVTRAGKSGRTPYVVGVPSKGMSRAWMPTSLIQYLSFMASESLFPVNIMGYPIKSRSAESQLVEYAGEIYGLGERVKRPVRTIEATEGGGRATLTSEEKKEMQEKWQLYLAALQDLKQAVRRDSEDPLSNAELYRPAQTHKDTLLEEDEDGVLVDTRGVRDFDDIVSKLNPARHSLHGRVPRSPRAPRTPRRERKARKNPTDDYAEYIKRAASGSAGDFPANASSGKTDWSKMDGIFPRRVRVSDDLKPEALASRAREAVPVRFSQRPSADRKDPFSVAELRPQEGFSADEFTGMAVAAGKALKRQKNQASRASSLICSVNRRQKLSSYVPPEGLLRAGPTQPKGFSAKKSVVWVSPPEAGVDRVMLFRRNNHIDCDFVATEAKNLTQLVALALQDMLLWLLSKESRRKDSYVYVGRVGSPVLQLAWRPSDPLTYEAMMENLKDPTLRISIPDYNEQEDKDNYERAALGELDFSFVKERTQKQKQNRTEEQPESQPEDLPKDGFDL